MGSDNLVKLRALVEVARALQNSLSTSEVLTTVVDAALAVTGCELGFLLLRENGDLRVHVARNREGLPIDPGELKIPVQVIQQALQQRRDLLSMSLEQSQDEADLETTLIADIDPRSVVCVPLVHIRGSVEETRVSSTVNDTAGILYMYSREGSADLSAGNRELLETLALEASTILENARLLDEERAKQRIEDELKIARTIQEGLLPANLPAAGWFRAAGTSIPSTQVGGDYFDVRQVAGDRWAAVVADVSGKGVSSALLASFLQGAFLMATPDPAAIEDMFRRLNLFLLDRTRGERYATIFYCVMDAQGLLNWANAGHCAPYLLNREGRLQKLHTTGMPVGMIENATVEVTQTELSAGDKIVIYSDGLTEAENAEGQFYDNERLRRLLTVNGHLSSAQLHERLLEDVDLFTEGGAVRDDITAVVLEYAP
jgi:serine phosphatase RsbU (regulator of sigma subunit)